MQKRFKKLQFLCKKKQEYRGLNFQAQPIFFGMDSKILEVFWWNLAGTLFDEGRMKWYFIEKYNDIALLADLMGHESIETTRIYLRMTASEQQKIVDKVVTW